MDIEGEAVIEEDLGSSDIEVLEETRKGGLKKPHKVKQAPKQSNDEEELDDFIERQESLRNRGEGRVKKVSAQHHGIFAIRDDEPEELPEERKKVNIYSKAEIEEQYATDRDLIIKNTDLPERLQKFTEE
jgi:hypothetical protein